MDLRSYRRWILPMLVAATLVDATGAPAAEYYSPEAIAARLACVAQQEPNLVRVHELGPSRDKRPVSLVEIGIGSEQDRGVRPALLVVAGIEGNDLVGPFTAVTWIERLVRQYQEDPSKADFLQTTTIYVAPCLNPDAVERFFGAPKMEMNVNGTPCDEDHDGLTDEDGGEDLNGDGLITMMRVKDKEGQYTADPNESRLLLRADPLRSETGTWRLLTEGIDNDHDKRWNEDGPGGTNFNRNFPYGYQYFAAQAGMHPVCEDETRALADFIVDHPNIGMVVTYGAADNVRKTPKADKSPGRSKPMEAIDEKDVGYYEAMGKLYRRTLGMGKELEGTSEPGTFSDWMYFHRGRLSLAVRPWDAALALELAGPKKAEDAADQEQTAEPNDPNTPGTDKKPPKDEDKRGQDERKQLTWFDEHAPDAFIAWQAIEHPDFPGRRVEVGGYRPFARTNPPVERLAGVAEKHGEFLTQVAQRLPRIKIARIECRLLADSIYEIEILVTNEGFLPTALAHGETTREVHSTRVALDLGPECFLSGTRTTFLPTIQGSDGTSKARYVIQAANRQEIRFQVVSMLAGRAEGRIELLKAGTIDND